MLLAVIIIPYSVTFQTILNGSVNYKTKVLTNSLGFVIWPLFGNLPDVLTSISNYECPVGASTCSYGLRTVFLYFSFGSYIVICNLLMFNMIIAIFSCKTQEITEVTYKAYSFKRYQFIKEIGRMTVLPAPLACLEYIARFLRIFVNFCYGERFSSYESFGK